MRIKFVGAFSFVLMLMLSSCGSGADEGVVTPRHTMNIDRDKSLRANRYLIKRDMEVMKSYIERHDLKLESSGLGYYYGVIGAKSSGKAIKKGSVVLYEYTIHMIDGTLLDSSQHELGQIIVDKSAGISGLHDGLKRLREGDSALFIFPPHVAFGLIGDGDKIPARATLVYSIRIKSVQ